MLKSLLLCAALVASVACKKEIEENFQFLFYLSPEENASAMASTTGQLNLNFSLFELNEDVLLQDYKGSLVAYLPRDVSDSYDLANFTRNLGQVWQFAITSGDILTNEVSELYCQFTKLHEQLIAPKVEGDLLTYTLISPCHSDEQDATLLVRMALRVSKKHLAQVKKASPGQLTLKYQYHTELLLVLPDQSFDLETLRGQALTLGYSYGQRDQWISDHGQTHTEQSEVPQPESAKRATRVRSI